MKNKNLMNDLNFTRKYIPEVIKPITKDAIFSIWISQDEIDLSKLQLLKLFVNSHLQMNKNATIFLLTNHANKINEHINDRRFIILRMPFVGMKFMTLKICAIYHLMRNFNNYQKLFIFDTDLLPMRNYDNLKIFKKNYDIGLTLHNYWKDLNKFPINAGFLIINFENKKKIEKFMDVFIESYEHVLNNQNEIIKSKYVSHKRKIMDLGNWYGDQYLYLHLLKKKINEKVNIYSDWEIDDLNYRVFDESIFNFSSLKLKKINSDFNINEYFERKIFQKRFFIHLKGNIKDKFLLQVAELLKIPV